MNEWKKLCPGCFMDKGSATICPHCEYDEKLQRSTVALPHRTLLQKQFIVGRILGSPGGFGITYLGWDLNLQMRVAIKEYFPTAVAGRDTSRMTVVPHSEEAGEVFSFGMKRFLLEARNLAKFDHPNLVRVRHFFEENETAYLVMDYYEGCTIEEHLKQKGGRLAEESAIEIMMQVLEGLKQVHGKGLLHRDIKPANIYFTKEGRAILLDFGAARDAIAQHSRGLTVILTPGFAPLEQHDRRRKQGPWTDLYSCAATLYKMITGEMPVAAADRVKHDKLLPPDKMVHNISTVLSSALVKTLAMKPEKRPQTVEAFQELLSKRKPEHFPMDAGTPTIGLTESGLADFQEKRKRLLLGVLGLLEKIKTKASVWAHAVVEMVKEKHPVWKQRFGESISKGFRFLARKPGGVVKGRFPIWVLGIGGLVLLVGIISIIWLSFSGEDGSTTLAENVVKSAEGASSLQDADVVAFGQAEGLNTVQSYRDYLSAYPSGKHASEARKKIDSLQAAGFQEPDDTSYQQAESLNTAQSYKDYLGSYPSGRHVTEAHEKIAEIEQRQQKISELLRRAQNYLSANKLSVPPGANALDVSREVLRLDPDNEKGVAIQKQIAARYEKLGDTNINQGRFNRAANYYQKSLDINPGAAGVNGKLAKAKQQSTQLAKSPVKDEGQTRSSEEIKLDGIEFILVKGGSFEMGDQFGDGDSDESPVHTVQLSDFYISKHEITFEQYDTFCEKTVRKKPEDDGWGRGKRPVINVSWKDAVAFCKWQSIRTGKTARLPTEAEWEYAAREQGKKTKWAGTSKETDLGKFTWNESNSSGTTHPVGEKQPNRLGIYDMSGNVMEWCEDRHDKNYYKDSPESNPKGPDPKSRLLRGFSEQHRILRGGSWDSKPKELRVSARDKDDPDKENNKIGFRIVRDK